MATVIPWIIMPMYVDLYFGGRTQRSNCESKFGAETKVTCDRVKEECLEPQQDKTKSGNCDWWGINYNRIKEEFSAFTMQDQKWQTVISEEFIVQEDALVILWIPIFS